MKADYLIIAEDCKYILLYAKALRKAVSSLPNRTIIALYDCTLLMSIINVAWGPSHVQINFSRPHEVVNKYKLEFRNHLWNLRLLNETLILD